MTQFVNEEVIYEAAVTHNVLPREFINPLSGTTPSVLNKKHFTVNSNGLITDFRNGAPAQKIYILGDGITSVKHGTNIFTNTGADKVLTANVVYQFTRFGNYWYESAGEGSSDDAPIPSPDMGINGTPGFLPVFTGPNSIGDSAFEDTGTIARVTGRSIFGVIVTGSLEFLQEYGYGAFHGGYSCLINNKSQFRGNLVSDSEAAAATLFRHRGTVFPLSLTPVLSGDLIGVYRIAGGYNTSGYTGHPSVEIRGYATEDYDGTQGGGRLEIWIVPDGDIVAAQAAIFENTGDLSLIGTALNISGDKIIGIRGSAVTALPSAPSGGGVQDAESRTAIGGLLTTVQDLIDRLGSAAGHGLFT